MSQTDAPLREMVPGRLGLIAEPFNPHDIVSKVQPGGASYYGRLVLHDPPSGDDAVKTPAGDLAAPAGVVTATHAIESQDDSDDPNYAAKKTVPVMTKGRAWVQIEADVDVGDEVWCRHTVDASLDKLGAFAPATGTGLTQIATGARWVKGGTAAQGIALLEFDVLVFS